MDNVMGDLGVKLQKSEQRKVLSFVWHVHSQMRINSQRMTRRLHIRDNKPSPVVSQQIGRRFLGFEPQLSLEECGLLVGRGI